MRQMTHRTEKRHCVNAIAVMALALLIASAPARAQRMSISTNLPTYALLGTVNVEADFAIGQHSTIGASVKFNPFEFRYKERDIYVHHVTPSINYSYWFWNYFSGFYITGKFMYSAYNTKNIRDFNAQGFLVGGGVSAGYGWILSKHLNLTLGLGAIAGWSWYARYPDDRFDRSCETGHKMFLLPEEPTIAFNIVF